MQTDNQPQAGCPCQNNPGRLIPGDLENIADIYTPDGASVDSAIIWMADHFRIQPGNVLTIVPKLRGDGRCVFFADGECAVSNVRPHGCTGCSLANREAHDEAGRDAIQRDHDEGGFYRATAEFIGMFGLTQIAGR